MSFYDDASLVFLPSGGAGKDGKAYSMKPVPEYGSELVTNGDFATDSDWIKGTGWTISGGTANCDGTQTGNTLLYQNIGHSSNTLYRLQFTISNYVSGTIDFALDSPFFGAANSNGTFVFDITPSSVGNFIVRADENFVGSIDNVSVKEITTSGDFTFSRGSNLTATRVDSNGLIEKGRENLLFQSNQFDTTWSTPSTDVTPNQSGYDGSTDAWLLEADVATSSANMNQSVSISGVMTASIYAKEGTTNWFRFSINDSGVNTRAWFDLSGSGAVGTTAGNIIDARIESVGNGYFRCSITFNATAANVFLFIANADNSISYSLGDNIYIQDAQIELGLVATEYIESGASKGKAGLLEQEPRFDYSGGASCPSLLLEPSRTNEIEYSEYFEGWTPQGSPTITSNYGTSPEGLQNSSRLVFTSASDYIETSVTNTSGVFTLYAKGTGNLILTDSGANASSTTALTSSYQRIELYFSTNTTTLQIKTDSSGLDAEVYAAQFENATYKTSYIPNHSGSGSVTRDADITSVTSVSDLIGQTEGTIYCEFEYNGAADSGVFNRIIGLGTGVTQNRILLAKNDTTAELVAFAVTGGTTQVFQAIAGTSIIGSHKVAISYKANEYKVYLDGELEFTDTSASVPATTDVYIGTAEDGTTDNELGGVVKQSIIYKEVLSEDNCKALTTL